MGYNQARLRRLNEARIAASGEYASSLSPYLHFGHVSIEQVVERLPTIAASRSGSA